MAAREGDYTIKLVVDDDDKRKLGDFDKDLDSFATKDKARADRVASYVKGVGIKSIADQKRAHQAFTKDLDAELKSRLKDFEGNAAAQAREHKRFLVMQEKAEKEHTARIAAIRAKDASGGGLKGFIAKAKGNFAKGSEEAGGGMMGALGGIGKMAGPWGAAIAGVGAAVGVAVNIMKDGIKAATEFGDRTKKISTLLSADQRTGLPDQMARLRDMSVELGVPLENLQNSFMNVVGAVPALGSNLASVTALTKLAAQGGIALGTSADTVTSAITALGNATGANLADLSVQNEIMDTLALTMNLGVTSGEALATNIAKAAPLYSQLAENASEATQFLGAATAAITANGVSTDEAQTLIKSFGSELSSSASRAKLMAAGLEGIDAQTGKVKDFSVLMQSLAKGGSKVQEAFSSLEAKQAVALFAKNGAAQMTDFIGQMEHAGGKTAEMYGIMATSGEQSAARLDAAKENILIGIGQSSSGLVSRLQNVAADALTSVMGFFQSADSKFQEAIGRAETMKKTSADLTALSGGISTGLGSGPQTHDAMSAQLDAVKAKLADIQAVSPTAAANVKAILDNKDTGAVDKLQQVNDQLKGIAYMSDQLAKGAAAQAQTAAAQQVRDSLDDQQGILGDIFDVATKIPGVYMLADAALGLVGTSLNDILDDMTMDDLTDGLADATARAEETKATLAGCVENTAEWNVAYKDNIAAQAELNEATTKMQSVYDSVDVAVGNVLKSELARGEQGLTAQQLMDRTLLSMGEEGQALAENEAMRAHILEASQAAVEADAEAASLAAEKVSVESEVNDLLTAQLTAAGDQLVTKEDLANADLASLQLAKTQLDTDIAKAETVLGAMEAEIAAGNVRNVLLGEAATLASQYAHELDNTRAATVFTAQDTAGMVTELKAKIATLKSASAELGTRIAAAGTAAPKAAAGGGGGGGGGHGGKSAAAREAETAEKEKKKADDKAAKDAEKAEKDRQQEADRAAKEAQKQEDDALKRRMDREKHEDELEESRIQRLREFATAVDEAAKQIVAAGKAIDQGTSDSMQASFESVIDGIAAERAAEAKRRAELDAPIKALAQQETDAANAMIAAGGAAAAEQQKLEGINRELDQMEGLLRLTERAEAARADAIRRDPSNARVAREASPREFLQRQAEAMETFNQGQEANRQALDQIAQSLGFLDAASAPRDTELPLRSTANFPGSRTIGDALSLQRTLAAAEPMRVLTRLFNEMSVPVDAVTRQMQDLTTQQEAAETALANFGKTVALSDEEIKRLHFQRDVLGPVRETGRGAVDQASIASRIVPLLDSIKAAAVPMFDGFGAFAQGALERVNTATRVDQQIRQMLAASGIDASNVGELTAAMDAQATALRGQIDTLQSKLATMGNEHRVEHQAGMEAMAEYQQQLAQLETVSQALAVAEHNRAQAMLEIGQAGRDEAVRIQRNTTARAEIAELDQTLTDGEKQRADAQLTALELLDQELATRLAIIDAAETLGVIDSEDADALRARAKAARNAGAQSQPLIQKAGDTEIGKKIAEVMGLVTDIAGAVQTIVDETSHMISAQMDVMEGKARSMGMQAMQSLKALGQGAADLTGKLTGLPIGEVFGAITGIIEGIVSAIQMAEVQNAAWYQQAINTRNAMQQIADAAARATAEMEKAAATQAVIDAQYVGNLDTSADKLRRNRKDAADLADAVAGTLTRLGRAVPTSFKEGTDRLREAREESARFAREVERMDHELSFSDLTEAEIRGFTMRKDAAQASQDAWDLATSGLEAYLANLAEKDELERGVIRDRVGTLDFEAEMAKRLIQRRVLEGEITEAQGTEEQKAADLKLAQDKLKVLDDLYATTLKQYNQGLVAESELRDLTLERADAQLAILQLQQQQNVETDDATKRELTRLQMERQRLILAARQNGMGVMDRAKVAGLEASILSKMQAGGATSDQIDAAKKAFAAASYATGTASVPKDDLYFLHQNEAVLTAAQVAQMAGGYQDVAGVLDRWVNSMADLQAARAEAAGGEYTQNVVINVMGGGDPKQTAQLTFQAFINWHDKAHARTGGTNR